MRIDMGILRSGLVFPFVISTFFLLTHCRTMNTLSYTYIDTNNNSYRISADSLSYRPISKEMSSSGTYDGGEPKKISLNPKDFQAIQEQIEAILSNQSLHQEKRMKPSSMLYKREKEGERTKAILKWRSPNGEREALESHLRDLLKM